MAADMLANSRGSETLTHGVRVTVTPEFEPAQSIAADDHFVFSYTIRITNESDRRVQLKRRSWTIIDSEGATNVVEGEGVVGHQPVIEPGDAFEYTSWCPLSTRWGTMEGAFEMDAEPGDRIRVTVARFILVAEESELLV